MNPNDCCTPSPLSRLRTALTYRTVVYIPIFFFGSKNVKKAAMRLFSRRVAADVGGYHV